MGEIRDLLVAAYRTGAKDVHDFLAKLPDDERQIVLRVDRPDLTEAAHSYVDAALKASTQGEEKGR
jgi:hypothetical protein